MTISFDFDFANSITTALNNTFDSSLSITTHPAQHHRPTATVATTATAAASITIIIDSQHCCQVVVLPIDCLC